MIKNKNEKNYDITIVGGGLAGKLMASILINCGAFEKINYVGLIQIIKILKIKE